MSESEQTTIKNSDGSYLSEAQIVNWMINTLQDEDTKKILGSNFMFDPLETEETKRMSQSTGFSPKAYYRITFGRQIRNNFGLWHKENPYTLLNPAPNSQGIIDNPLFPDNMSARIIDELVRFYNYEMSQKYGELEENQSQH